MYNNLTMSPIISVVIPCYKQAIYLPDALNSLLEQTYKSWEGIIVNDGSPDNTQEVALAYVEKDSRFKYIKKTNGGLSSARNSGINHACGEYILPLDADDILAPTYLEKAVKVFTDFPQTTLVYCQGCFFGVREGVWDLHYEDYQTLLLGNSIFCSALYRKDDCISIGGYDEKMKLGYEDWEFYIRLLNDSSVVYQIPEVLFSYRKKEISMVTECEKRIVDVHNYIFAKNIDKYQIYFGSAIDSLQNLMYYRKKVEKYKRKWYRRLFVSVKALFHR